MSQAERNSSDGASTPPTPSAAPSAGYAREALRLNGIVLSAADLELTVGEIERALEIVRPLLDHALPDGLDQAGIYRP